MIEVIENEIVVEVTDGPEIVVEVGDGPILPEWGMIGGEIENQDDLMAALAAKADSSAVYTKQETDTALAAKADSSAVYTKQETDTALAAKADSSAVYTKQETDTALASKADSSAVYTKQETDTALAAKADSSAVYTKQETDTALAAKADSSAVYTKQETDSALASKADIEDVDEGFQLVGTVLSQKADKTAVYTKQETDTALASKADSSAVYTKQETDTALAAKADKTAVYTKQETDTALSSKADSSAVYTKQETDTALDDKADSSAVYTKQETDDLLAGKLALHGTADQSGGVVPILLTNEDLNNLRPEVTTWYYCQNSANIGNRPPSNPGTFGLVVYRLANLGRYQVLTATNGLIYSRTFRSDGVGWSEWLQWNVNYQLPTASASVLGGMMVGRNLSIENGVLSADASGIVCEVSGNPVSVSDACAAPVLGLSVGIEPVQDLHGYDGAWVPGGGKNTWVQITPGTYTNGGITAVVDSNNLITVSGTKNTDSEVKIEMPYQISGTIGEINYYVHLRNTAAFENTKVYFNMQTSSTTKVYFNTINRILLNTANRVFQSCGLVFTSSVPSGTEYNFTFQPSLENTDAVTEWTPYSNICPISGWTAAELTVNGTSVPVSFPSEAGTVYGGTLDAVNQVLTVNRKMVIFDGSENWMSSGGGFYLDNISAIADVSRTIKPACNLLRWDEDVRKTMSDITEGFIAFSTANNQINLKTSAFSAVGEFKDFISVNNLQVCGYLVTPVTYQLTPLEVRTVLGQNSVSADCGAVSLRYGADTKLYIDGKFAELT